MPPLRRHPAWMPPPGPYAGLFLLALLLNVWMVNFTRANGGIGVVWVSNGLLLGVLLTSPYAHRHAYIGARILCNLAAHLVQGDSFAVSLSFGLCGGIELALAGRMLHQRADSLRLLGQPAGLLRFLLWGALVPPLLSITLASVMMSELWQQPLWALIAPLAPASAAGIVISVPLVMALRQAGWSEPFIGERWRGNMLAFLACLGCTAAVFAQARYPLLALPLPLMLLVAGRMGLTGTAIQLAAVSAIMVSLTMLGHGPLAGFSPLERASLLQISIAIIVLASFPVAMTAADRRRADIAHQDNASGLARSEWLFRRLAENSSDIITRTALNGRRLYVSPAVEWVLGYAGRDVIDPAWRGTIHPEDAAILANGRARLVAGEDRVMVQIRFRRADGEYAWLESHMSLVRNAAGQPEEIISTARDITQQKAMEAALAKAHSELQHQVSTDGLTGIANRRRFDEVLEAEWHRAMRNRAPIGVLMVDVDYFKSYNDSAGHLAGDDCLRAIAGAIAQAVRRPGDLVARYGGEEFGVILPETSQAGGLEIAHRMRTSIASLALSHPGRGGLVTVSIGLAWQIPQQRSSRNSLVEYADRALYRAKTLGRDRIEPDFADAGACNVLLLPPGRSITG